MVHDGGTYDSKKKGSCMFMVMDNRFCPLFTHMSSDGVELLKVKETDLSDLYSQTTVLLSLYNTIHNTNTNTNTL